MSASRAWSTVPIKAPDLATRQILRKLAARGCEMRRTGSGHVQVRVPGRPGCLTTSLTPSHTCESQILGLIRRHLGISL